ncbi:unnamed protein product [Tilletia controversa]|nr:unnamed protein product [Tilletia controversa]
MGALLAARAYGLYGGLDVVFTVPAFYSAPERRCRRTCWNAASPSERWSSSAMLSRGPSPSQSVTSSTTPALALRAPPSSNSPRKVTPDSITTAASTPKEVTYIDVLSVGWNRNAGGLALDLILRDLPEPAADEAQANPSNGTAEPASSTTEGTASTQRASTASAPQDEAALLAEAERQELQELVERVMEKADREAARNQHRPSSNPPRLTCASFIEHSSPIPSSLSQLPILIIPSDLLEDRAQLSTFQPSLQAASQSERSAPQVLARDDAVDASRPPPHHGFSFSRLPVSDFDALERERRPLQTTL